MTLSMQRAAARVNPELEPRTVLPFPRFSQQHSPMGEPCPLLTFPGMRDPQIGVSEQDEADAASLRRAATTITEDEDIEVSKAVAMLSRLRVESPDYYRYAAISIFGAWKAAGKP